MCSLQYFLYLAAVNILWLLLSSPCSCSTADPLTVQISDGEILGTQFVSTWTNKTIFAFLGIPYASAPTGDQRFKLPVPPQKWTTTKNCTQLGAACMQPGNPNVSEDCLFVNVYSPELNPSGALAPVYVWIHGGEFMIGAGGEYGPDPMVAEGVVVVTINYRLGAFGFLTLGTSEVPGNVALFDQVLAMKWVQKEISKFGGDPNKVTIGGESAGSMMVHLHYISPVSKGLFHAAIGESGTSLRVMVPDGAPEFGLRFAELVNCSDADISVTQQCLMSLSADVIVNAEFLTTVPAINSVQGYLSFWVPTVDKDTNKDNPFLPAHPADLIAQGVGSSVPFLMGTNKDEGTFSIISPGYENTIQILANNLQDMIPSQVLADSSNSSIQEKEKEIKAKYFGGKDPSISNLFGYVKMVGDYTFDYPTSLSAQSFRSRSSVFLYRFIFDGDFRWVLTDQFDEQCQARLVGHADELSYLFLVPALSNQTGADPNSREMITFNRMVRLWTNFIKYGTPTPSEELLLQNVIWTPVQSNSLHYLEISDNLTMVQSDYQADVVQFWDSIYAKPSPSSASTLVASLFAISVFALLVSYK